MYFNPCQFRDSSLVSRPQKISQSERHWNSLSVERSGRTLKEKMQVPWVCWVQAVWPWVPNYYFSSLKLKFFTFKRKERDSVQLKWELNGKCGDFQTLLSSRTLEWLWRWVAPSFLLQGSSEMRHLEKCPGLCPLMSRSQPSKWPWWRYFKVSIFEKSWGAAS